MPFCQLGSLKILKFDKLDFPGIEHAVFTRHGGVSSPPWAELNLGGTVGDAQEHVVENRRRAFAAIGRDVSTVYDAWQVHSADVVCVNSPRLPSMPHVRADVLLTDKPHITLLMRFADCVPILLYDPYQQVVGLVHAGWQGTIKMAARAAVETMCSAYGSIPRYIHAAIGPSIGPDHYTVGPDVAYQVAHTFGDDAKLMLHNTNGVEKLDLWEANKKILKNCGVMEIEEAQLCTACHIDDWFSHRGENGRTGRFGVMIGLKY